MRHLMTALAGLAVCGLGQAALAATPPKPAAAPAAQPPAPADAPWPEATFEIFKLAPGKQEAFIRRIARNDEVRRAGGLPPTQVFFHEDGADWDVLVFKPHNVDKPTPEQKAAMDAKRRELGVESGPAYFVAVRELLASHNETTAVGPISAAQWLAKLEAWRAEHPAAAAPR